MFLPAYFANASNNPNVGFHLALMVFADLIVLVRSQFSSDKTDRMTVNVDLSELAGLAKEEKCLRDFDCCTQRLCITWRGGDMLLQVQIGTRSDGQQVEQLDLVSLLVQRMSRRLQAGAQSV